MSSHNLSIAWTAIDYAFVVLLMVLVTASVTVALMMRLRPHKNYAEMILRIKTWWGLAAMLFIALAFGHTVATTLLALVSFMAFKEFLTIVPTRQSDGRVLLLAYLAIPFQYIWVGMAWYGMFIIFIPVYVFLLLPMRMVLIGETRGFLRAAGSIQWGLMTTVFSISHIGYLFNMPVYNGLHGHITGEMLVLYLLVLTQANDIAQYLWGKWLGKHPVAPTVSPNKTVEGLLGGIVTTTLIAWFAAPWLTPMSPLHAVFAGILISLFGFIGDVVISAIKRDIGVKDAGTLLPGHGGMLDRLDSLTYTAPLFFHYLYYLYY